MSDLDLERTATAPHRWIELCGTLEKLYRNDPGATLRPRATRIINDSLDTGFGIAITDFFIVPGGRYLVGPSHGGISILDLGCTSSAESASADCKLIASVELVRGYKSSIVQATPDGMGLTIFVSSA